jgi:hypothetical protein
MSRLERFSLRTLSRLDSGKYAILIDNLIERTLADLRERPHDDKPRKVNIQFEFSPADPSDEDCREVEFRMVAKTSVPNRRLMPHRLILHANNQASFQPDEVTGEQSE